MLDVVVFLVSLGVRAIRAMCRRRADQVLENVALRQLAFFNVIVVHSGLLEFLLIPFSPLRVSIRRALGHLPTHQEEIFMTICGRRAAKYGVELDWTALASSLRRTEV